MLKQQIQMLVQHSPQSGSWWLIGDSKQSLCIEVGVKLKGLISVGIVPMTIAVTAGTRSNYLLRAKDTRLPVSEEG